MLKSGSKDWVCFKEVVDVAKRRLDTLGKVMSKVSRGKKLSRIDRNILSGAIDAAKKAKSERRKRGRRKK